MLFLTLECSLRNVLEQPILFFLICLSVCLSVCLSDCLSVWLIFWFSELLPEIMTTIIKIDSRIFTPWTFTPWTFIPQTLTAWTTGLRYQVYPHLTVCRSAWNTCMSCWVGSFHENFNIYQQPSPNWYWVPRSRALLSWGNCGTGNHIHPYTPEYIITQGWLADHHRSIAWRAELLHGSEAYHHLSYVCWPAWNTFMLYV